MRFTPISKRNGNKEESIRLDSIYDVLGFGLREAALGVNVRQPVADSATKRRKTKGESSIEQCRHTAFAFARLRVRDRLGQRIFLIQIAIVLVLLLQEKHEH